jgi:membrane peptidoglycan carboxypeptidase
MNKLDAYLLTKARRQRRSRLYTVRSIIWGRIGWGFAAVVAILFSVAILWGTWQYSQLTSDLPSIDNIPKQLNAQSATFTQPTRLIDRSGTQLVKELSVPGVQRKFIRIEGIGTKVSQDFVDAFVAILEPNYWRSSGINYMDFNPDNHPTIAQKLAYHMLLAQEPASLRRAFREKLLATQIISQYGRDQVLEWYINSLDFGNMAYGVEAGAQLYFGKTSSALSLPEAAMLAGVAAAPALNPWDSPAGAKALQIEALKAMAIQGKITTVIFRLAIDTNPVITIHQDLAAGGSEAFSREVIDQLDKVIGRERVERGGLTIQTTLDSALQQNLECTIQAQLESLQGNQQVVAMAARTCPASRLLPLLPPGDSLPSGSVAASAVVMDPTNGQILAMTGEMNSTRTNPVEGNHPAGTLITPFVYLNGFSQGLSPANLVWDVASSSETSSPVIANLDGKSHGPVRIRIAMDNDYLIPAFSILKQTGWDSFSRLTSSLGLTMLPLTGTQTILDEPVSLRGMAEAYSVLASGGMKYGSAMGGISDPEQNFVLNVWDENGRLIYSAGEPARSAIISSQLAYLVNSVLGDDLARRPSLGSPSLLQLGQPSAAKMGQNLAKDQVWTAGYTPQRTVVVWMGSAATNTTPVKLDPRWAAGIWRAIIQSSIDGLPTQGFTRPAETSMITVCDPSGLLPTEACPNTVDEVFINGNEPVSGDTLYHKLIINAETNQLATVFTPPDMVQEKIYLDIPAEYQAWAKQAGLELAPTSYDVLQDTVVIPAVHITSPEMFSYVHGKVQISGTASANAFASYQVQIGQGLNPSTWQQIGTGASQPVIEGPLAEWDTTGLNGLYVVRLQVVDKQNVLKTSMMQVTVDNIPPEIKLRYPVDGAILDSSTTPDIFVKADVTDTVEVKQVEIDIDGRPVTSLESGPFYINWKAVPGEHVIQVKAWDEVGNISQSPEIHFHVK